MLQQQLKSSSTAAVCVVAEAGMGKSSLSLDVGWKMVNLHGMFAMTQRFRFLLLGPSHNPSHNYRNVLCSMHLPFFLQHDMSRHCVSGTQS